MTNYYNDNLKYIKKKKLYELSDDIYDKPMDIGKYIWDLDIFKNKIKPTLQKHFYDDDYYLDKEKIKKLPTFYFVPYIDIPNFIFLKPELSSFQKLISIYMNNHIIKELNNKQEFQFELIKYEKYADNETINKKYKKIQKYFQNIINEVENLIEYTYKIKCKREKKDECKEKMDYLHANLLTKNYHKGLSDEYSKKIMDSLSIISKNILLEYKKLLTEKILEIFRINDIDIDIDYNNIIGNNNNDFILNIINKLKILLKNEELNDEQLKDILLEDEEIKSFLLKDEQINRLIIQEQKDCKNLFKFGSFKEYVVKRFDDKYLKDKILLQDIFNELDKFQLLYIHFEYIKYYKNNNLITQEPFIERSKRMSILSWNNLINKALTNCWINNSEQTFSLRMVLNKHTGFLHFRNSFNDLNTAKYRFVGFFLIKIDKETNHLVDMTKIKNENCKKYYDFTDSNKNIDDYVIFVFREYTFNNDTKAYTTQKNFFLFNYKCNEVDFGSISEFKRILYIGEIQQVICMNIQEKAYFYILFEKASKKNELEKYKNLSNICSTLKNVEENKKKINDCLEANIEPIFLNKLLHFGYYPYSVKNNYKITDIEEDIIDEQHVFVSKKNYEEIKEHLKTKTKIEEINTELYYNSINSTYTRLKLESKQITDNQLNENIINIINQSIINEEEKKKLIVHNDLSYILYKIKKHRNNIINNKFIEFESEDKKYGLFQCHFDWLSNSNRFNKNEEIKKQLKKELNDYKTEINFYNKASYSTEELQKIQELEDNIRKLYLRERLYIKDGDMSDKKKEELKKDQVCIDDLCTLRTDIIRDVSSYFNRYSPSPINNELNRLFYDNSGIFKDFSNSSLEESINVQI